MPFAVALPLLVLVPLTPRAAESAKDIKLELRGQKKSERLFHLAADVTGIHLEFREKKQNTIHTTVLLRDGQALRLEGPLTRQAGESPGQRREVSLELQIEAIDAKTARLCVTETIAWNESSADGRECHKTITFCVRQPVALASAPVGPEQAAKIELGKDTDNWRMSARVLVIEREPGRDAREPLKPFEPRDERCSDERK